MLVYTRSSFSSIVKQAMFAYVNHARIRSWNQPVLLTFRFHVRIFPLRSVVYVISIITLLSELQ